jgi:hypothetical protein
MFRSSDRFSTPAPTQYWNFFSQLLEKCSHSDSDTSDSSESLRAAPARFFLLP